MGITAASKPPTPPDDIVAVPPPWKLKATVWMFAFYTSKDQAKNFPDMTYSPLEGGSDFPTYGGSKPIGGISMIQLISYSDTPVGPYDELILAPGYHEYEVEENGKRVKKRNARVTRIYVSQKYTNWNGRVNWNIPKHMADFRWTDNKDGSRTVKVYPHDTVAGGAVEGTVSPTPLFQATMKPVSYVPYFPLSLRIFGWLGFDFTLVHPPLPEGKGKHGEVPGTDRWAAVMPGQYSSKASLAWFDMSQTDEEGKRHGLYENFWPGLKRWHVGVRMDDCDIDFPEPRVWDPIKASL